jgi:hypothetical protein
MLTGNHADAVQPQAVRLIRPRLPSDPLDGASAEAGQFLADVVGGAVDRGTVTDDAEEPNPPAFEPRRVLSATRYLDSTA